MLKSAMLLVLGLTVSTAVGAEIDHFSIESDLRLSRRRTMLHSDSSPLLRDTEDRYITRSRAEIFWEHGLSAALALQWKGFAHRADADDTTVKGVSEAVIHFFHIGFLPVNASIGRQHLHLGRGLIISDEDRAWSFDSLHLSADIFPRRLDLSAGRIAHVSPESDLKHFASVSWHYEPPRPPLGKGTLYAVAAGDSSNALYIGGTRAEWLLSPSWSAWSEGALQTGEAPGKRTVAAWITDGGILWHSETAPSNPSLSWRWTFASGADDSLDKRGFEPMMDQGFGGMVVKPRLSNMHVLALQTGINPTNSLRLGLEGYAYIQHQPSTEAPGRIDRTNEGTRISPNGQDRLLGWELNILTEVQLSEDASASFGVGRFQPETGYRDIMSAPHIEWAAAIEWRY